MIISKRLICASIRKPLSSPLLQSKDWVYEAMIAKRPQIAVVGSGPAALMAADVISAAGYQLSIFEKYPGPGRKLFIAGSSGLNITNSLHRDAFAEQYKVNSTRWKYWLQRFSPSDWIAFVENLGLDTFCGTSGRYFVSTMNAALLLRLWRKRLIQQGVNFVFNKECSRFYQDSSKWTLEFSDSTSMSFVAVVFALGGASYQEKQYPLRWTKMFDDQGIALCPFEASNVGYQVDWPPEFIAEADGKPLKNIRLSSSKGSMLGDLMVTSYGLEGSPIYTLGQVGQVHLDLKPDLDEDEIISRCQSSKRPLSPMRMIKRRLNLCPASLALLYHLTPQDEHGDLRQLCRRLKDIALSLIAPQPLEEAISSSGGILSHQLDDELMFKCHPGLFAAGEMLDWDAPTGGFLIQGCVSQGYVAGQALVAFIRSKETM